MPNLLGLNDLPVETITYLLDQSERFQANLVPVLAGKTVCTFFVEDSTRTRLSFEHAAKQLGAEVMTFSANGSSMAKGETLKDTVHTLNAMGLDAMVIRHRENGVPGQIAQWIDLPILNGGDGNRAHPTQGLLDLLTIRQHFGHIDGVTVSIVGDLAHSRVMRSLVSSLPRMGASVRLVAPAPLMPADIATLPVTPFTNMNEALVGTDVVYLLRIQHERMTERFKDINAYVREYGLTEERMACLEDHVVVMHPGPVNRDVEIASALMDHPKNLVLAQVSNGVAVRMAALDWAINH